MVLNILIILIRKKRSNVQEYVKGKEIGILTYSTIWKWWSPNGCQAKDETRTTKLQACRSKQGAENLWKKWGIEKIATKHHSNMSTLVK